MYRCVGAIFFLVRGLANCFFSSVSLKMTSPPGAQKICFNAGAWMKVHAVSKMVYHRGHCGRRIAVPRPPRHFFVPQHITNRPQVILIFLSPIPATLFGQHPKPLMDLFCRFPSDVFLHSLLNGWQSYWTKFFGLPPCKSIWGFYKHAHAFLA